MGVFYFLKMFKIAIKWYYVGISVEKGLLTIWFMIIWKMNMIRMMKMTIIK